MSLFIETTFVMEKKKVEPIRDNIGTLGYFQYSLIKKVLSAKEEGM